jgi:hypothetical protein
MRRRSSALTGRGWNWCSRQEAYSRDHPQKSPRLMVADLRGPEAGGQPGEQGQPDSQVQPTRKGGTRLGGAKNRRQRRTWTGIAWRQERAGGRVRQGWASL